VLHQLNKHHKHIKNKQRNDIAIQAAFTPDNLSTDELDLNQLNMSFNHINFPTPSILESKTSQVSNT